MHEGLVMPRPAEAAQRDTRHHDGVEASGSFCPIYPQFEIRRAAIVFQQRRAVGVLTDARARREDLGS